MSGDTDARMDGWIREMLRVDDGAESDSPVDEMWARIEADVEAAVRAHRMSRSTAGPARRAARMRWFAWPRPVTAWAVAAAVLVAVASATLLVLQQSGGTGEGDVTGAAPLLAVVADYERAISDIEGAAASRGVLTGGEAGAVMEALEAVDMAIDETRTALERAPSDPYYQNHLIKNLELKLSILEGSLRL